MDTYVKIAACSVVCAILCAVLKPHEGAISLSYTGLSSAVFSPLLKTVAIAILGQVAGAFCQDAGQGALGKMVELCGTVLCLCTGLPLATMLLELLRGLGGG